MTCASLDSAMLRWVHAPNKGVRRIAIVLFNDCSLQSAGVIAEVFQAANELAASGSGAWLYDVSFLSVDGGMVGSSSGLRVWTEGLDARHYGGFDALYVAGGKGAALAARDERLIGWLRRVRRNTAMIRPIAEGRAVLDAAYLSDGRDDAELEQPAHGVNTADRAAHSAASYAGNGAANGAANGGKNAGTNGATNAGTSSGTNGARAPEHGITEPGDRLESMRSALAMIKRDLGNATARMAAERLLADSCTNLAPLLGEDGAMSPGDKVRAAARWLQENCQQSISIADAAQFAAMSERNFLRRFKMEMGITPSSFLLHERLAVTCSLLTESELPVDKIARRTGMGNGDRLAKVFRKRMRISPTEFRIQSRRMGGE
ncbi:helix-turn-helix domain-containing protein [Paraburkholderia sp. MMS20-SJTR3]|uniref:Helix-turn-helix domain-containing protein n=1 Tax=Paraburkholderia sejongensis TaxID=2886946 RepID=A0ABS8JPN2_9BURK|nr:helix-turn-helix domain-containing protein [Paraburkholderia sp. MMS20-SJTR3]MCC8391836.1 helix-turn-helix domain-containing protein [Paraburkholderia sp. MMS20-SJTR3]